jgi:uncharacterized protein (TIGR00251 family)
MSETESTALDIRDFEGGCLIRVRLTPKASSNRILGIADGVLRLSVQAPPVEGAANAKAREFLAKTLGVSKGSVILERGQTSRDKLFRIDGMAREDIRARLLPPSP